MHPVDTVRLEGLMSATAGSAAVQIGLIDGPVDASHTGFDSRRLSALGGPIGCKRPDSVACQHGTFVAGILHARRGGRAPALCPESPLLVRAIFTEAERGGLPTCHPQELAAAITECVDAGVRLLNLSVGVLYAAPAGESALRSALDHAARHGALVVAASGNQGAIGGSALARHAAVIPVIAAGTNGRVAEMSNLGTSIGQRGLAAPGEGIESLSSSGGTRRSDGTSAAAPFVTGAAALLWSIFPRASAALIRHAMTQASMRRRTSIVPPLLDAQRAWDWLKAA